MKLKEKLALKFAAETPDERPILGIEAFAAYSDGRHQGFLAGFDQAREMSALVYATSLQKYAVMPTENALYILHPFAYKLIRKDIMEIGEKESK